MHAALKFLEVYGVEKHRRPSCKRAVALVLVATLLFACLFVVAYADDSSYNVNLDTLLAGSSSGKLETNDVFFVSIASNITTINFTTSWAGDAPIFGTTVALGTYSPDSVTKNDTYYEASFANFNENKSKLSGFSHP